MKGTTYTEYTFQVNGEVKVSVQGSDTDLAYEEALKVAMSRLSDDMDEDCLEYVESKEYEEYEHED